MARKRKEKAQPAGIQLPLFDRAYAAKVIEEIPRPTPTSRLDNALIWFGVFLSSLEYSPNTVDSYTTSVELLSRYLGPEFPLRGIGTRQLNGYLEWLAKRYDKPPVKTLALRVTGVRKFFEVLQENGILPNNPAEDFYAPQGEVPLPDIVTPEEEERMREAAWAAFHAEKRDTRPLFLLMLTLDLGLRRGELEDLKRGQIGMGFPEVTVRIHYPQRRHRYKNRVLLAPPEFREVYRAYLQQYPSESENVLTASRRTLHRVVERLGKAVGAAVRVTPMVMRWTCALRWYEELPPEEVQGRLGLSPIGWQDAERVLQGLQKRRDRAKEVVTVSTEPPTK